MSTDKYGTELTKKRPLPDWMYATPDGRNQRINELEAQTPAAVISKKIGRPRGAKNKPKADTHPTVPRTVWTYWLDDECYGYAFKSVEDYRRFVTKAVAELMGERAVSAGAVEAGAKDLAKFVRVKGGA